MRRDGQTGRSCSCHDLARLSFQVIQVGVLGHHTEQLQISVRGQGLSIWAIIPLEQDVRQVKKFCPSHSDERLPLHSVVHPGCFGSFERFTDNVNCMGVFGILGREGHIPYCVDSDTVEGADVRTKCMTSLMIMPLRASDPWFRHKSAARCPYHAGNPRG